MSTDIHNKPAPKKIKGQIYVCRTGSVLYFFRAKIKQQSTSNLGSLQKQRLSFLKLD